MSPRPELPRETLLKAICSKTVNDMNWLRALGSATIAATIDVQRTWAKGAPWHTFLYLFMPQNTTIIKEISKHTKAYRAKISQMQKWACRTLEPP